MKASSFRSAFKFGSAPARCFHDDMHITVFCKGRQVNEVRHGEGPKGALAAQRRKRRTDAQDKAISCRMVPTGGQRCLNAGLRFPCRRYRGVCLKPPALPCAFKASWDCFSRTAPSIALATLSLSPCRKRALG